MSNVERRNVICHESESILVMIKTAMNKVAITVREPNNLTFRRNLWPYRTLRITKIAFGMLEDIAAKKDNNVTVLVSKIKN